MPLVCNNLVNRDRLIWVARHCELMALDFPRISGFALISPAATIGHNEMNRRHEAGRSAGCAGSFAVFRSPRFGVTAVLAVGLLSVFFASMVTASWMLLLAMGPEAPGTALAFIGAVLTTDSGRAMILLGVQAGFAFAVLVLATSIVSFRLLIDRQIGLPQAVVTSVRVVGTSPASTAVWGRIVVAMLAPGAMAYLWGREGSSDAGAGSRDLASLPSRQSAESRQGF